MGLKVMLRTNEVLNIGDGLIMLSVYKLGSNRAELEIDAPKDIRILRQRLVVNELVRNLSVAYHAGEINQQEVAAQLRTLYRIEESEVATLFTTITGNAVIPQVSS